MQKWSDVETLYLSQFHTMLRTNALPNGVHHGSSHPVAVSQNNERPMSASKVLIEACSVRCWYYGPSQWGASNVCGKMEARLNGYTTRSYVGRKGIGVSFLGYVLFNVYLWMCVYLWRLNKQYYLLTYIFPSHS